MALPKFVSDSSGRPTAFNVSSWGGPSCSYITSAKKLKKKYINEIIKRAKAFSRTTRQSSTKAFTGTSNPVVVDDHRANLVDDESASEEDNNDDCKFSYLKILILFN